MVRLQRSNSKTALAQQSDWTMGVERKNSAWQSVSKVSTIDHLRNKRVFLAAPFSKKLSPSGIVSNKTYKTLLTRIHDGYYSCGLEVFLALKREEWGKSVLPPEKCTPLDMIEMRKCDYVVALPSTSGGVHIELGWASCLNKPIFLLLQKNKTYSPLVLGLNRVTNVYMHYFSTLYVDEVINSSIKWFDEIEQNKRRLNG